MKALYRFLSSSACIIAIIVFAVLAAVMCACTITYDGDVNFTGSTWMNPISMYSIIGLLLAVIIIPFIPKAWHFACNANMRATAIICMAVIAIIITIIVSALKTCEHNGIIMRALTAIIVCMMAWLGSIVPVMIMQRFTDVNLYDGKQPPMSWIAMGTVYNEGSGTPGFFNETYLGDTWKNWQDTETTNRHMYDAAKQNISKLTDNQLWVSFIASKITYTYADPSFVAFSRPVAEYMVWNGMPEQYDYIRQLQDRRIHDGTAVAKPYQQFILNNIQWVSVPFDALQALPSMLAFIGICTIWNNRRRMKTAGINMQTLLPALCVIGGFLFHLLWETQPEYGFTYFLLLIPYAVCAMPACQHSLVHVMHV